MVKMVCVTSTWNFRPVLSNRFGGIWNARMEAKVILQRWLPVISQGNLHPGPCQRRATDQWKLQFEINHITLMILDSLWELTYGTHLQNTAGALLPSTKKLCIRRAFGHRLISLKCRPQINGVPFHRNARIFCVSPFLLYIIDASSWLLPRNFYVFIIHKVITEIRAYTDQHNDYCTNSCSCLGLKNATLLNFESGCNFDIATKKIYWPSHIWIF